ncbi:MAG: C25 family cysteine peptidase [Candidatus Syntrophosphaera sp.]
MRRLILIPLLLALLPLFAAETVQIGNGVNSAEVISSTASETVVQFNLGEYEKTKVEIDGEEWFQVSLRKEGKLLEAGFPELPVMNRSIIIDDQALMKLEVYDLEFEEIELPIAPSKGDLTRNIDPATVPYTFDRMYERDEFYPDQVATLSEPYIMRDYRGIVVKTAPFAYNPVTRTLRIYTSYKVRVYAEGMDTVNVLTRSRDEISREFMGIYENHFLNWDDSRYTSVSDSFGKLLIIYYDAFEDAITPYFEWKRQKGVPTYFIPFSDVGTTASQLDSYIQSMYNSDGAITFVQLVGDAAQIPTLSVGGGGADPVFALVSGTDSYPDIFVSRFSASTAADVTTQVNKILTYERDFTTSQTWMQWATGVASAEGPGDDGEYDWQHMDNIRNDLLGYGYTIVDRIYPNQGNDTAAYLSSCLNGGSSFMNYCGHGWTYGLSTTGFNTTDVSNLTNGVKTPIICSVACLNGNFVSYTCLAEAFLRKSGGGGIAFYGSSVNQSWNPPMAAQDEVADLLVADAKKTVGGLFFNGSCKMLDDYPTSGDMYKTWNIFGDASMLARTKNPMAMTVTHTTNINVGETSTISVATGVPYAYVGITYGTSIYGYGYANYLGNFTTTLSPSNFMEYTITVTAHNRVTYVGKIYAGYIWDGSSSTVWSTGSNWNTGSAPTSTKDVLIPNGCPRYPVTSATTGYARNLTVLASTSVTVNAYDLLVSGDATIYGQLNMNQSTDFEIIGNVIWKNGSTASITASAAEIYCKGNMVFEPGSDVQFDMGYLEFWGDAMACFITNKSPNTELYNLRSDMGDGDALVISDDSTYDLVINGSVWNYEGSSFYCWYEGNVYLNGLYLRDYNSATTYGIKMYYPTLIMDGGTQYIDLQGPNCYLNNLTISSTGAVSLQTDLTLNNDLVIESGIFDPGGWGITIGGNWANMVGPVAFNEGTSTVTFNGDGHQYCNYTETFNTLAVDCVAALRVNNASAVVTCAHYDWISGAIDVLSGTFTALDLVDNGLYGAYYVNPGATINLTNDDGYVDLNGDLIFSSGGTINVYGGTTDSYWPYLQDASITMNGGILDFKDQGIRVTTGHDLTTNITAGTIRTAESFQVYRTDFNPTGGLIEMVGDYDSSLNHSAGSNLFSVKINKSSTRDNGDDVIYETDKEGRTREITRTNLVTVGSNLDINGYMMISAGTFNASDDTLYVRGHWYNYDDAAFNEGTGLVVFDGNTQTDVYADEVFNAVELNKTLATINLNIPSSRSLTCDSYDWTQGRLNVTGGDFTALDLVDPGIMGEIILTGGTVNLHQDASQYIDMRGTWNISGGEMHLWGGDGNSYWPWGTSGEINMSAGLIHRHDSGINIPSTYTLTENITGGTIRTDGSFYCYRSDFTPSGGTLEFVGSLDAALNNTSGTLYNITVNKTGATALAGSEPVIITQRDGSQQELTRTNNVYMSTDVNCNGNLNVTSGSFSTSAHDLNCAGNVDVNGIMSIPASGALIMSSGKTINVNNGGNLNVIGNSTNAAMVTCSSGYYGFDVESGGTLGANYGIFEKMNANGVYVKNGALVSTTYPLDNCTFRLGASGGRLLWINNNQSFTVNGAMFPTNTWGGAYNVSKTANSGSVYFANWSGDFGGPAYEQDTYGRIFWEGTGIPTISDLSISYIPASNLIRLDWTYPLTATEYKIYRSATPDGTFLYEDSTTNHYWTQTVPGDIYFYRVTAVMP